jgi:CheY-like chemotaxis protein
VSYLPDHKRDFCVLGYTRKDMRSPEDLEILVVDDNKVNQRLAMLIFSQMGLKCDVASDGKEAFEMVQQKAYDLIFMDLQMPVLDGLESTKLIRTFETDSKTLHRAKIIALSGSELKENKVECLAVGMDDFIEKPIRVEKLNKFVSQVSTII